MNLGGVSVNMLIHSCSRFPLGVSLFKQYLDHYDNFSSRTG
jgi:hypothetical protein